jgi:uncharacterized membrane protein
MMAITRERELRAAPELVFSTVSDRASFPALFERTARWQPVRANDFGKDSRHVVLVHAGSVIVRSVVQIDQLEAPHLLAYSSVSGIRQSGRVQIRPCDSGSHVSIHVAVSLPGGLLARVAELYLERILTPRLDAALLALRRRVEFGDARA